MSVEAVLASLVDEMKLMRGQLDALASRHTKDYYSTEEFATMKGMKPKTVRD